MKAVALAFLLLVVMTCHSEAFSLWPFGNSSSTPSNCQFTAPSGYVYDFGAMEHTGGATDYESDGDSTNTNTKYYFNICGNAARNCLPSPDSGSSASGTTVSCQNTGIDNHNHPCGLLSSQTFTEGTAAPASSGASGSIGMGGVLSYTGGQECKNTKRAFNIHLVCDPTVLDTPTLSKVSQESDGCTYDVTVTHEAACPIAAAWCYGCTGPTWGWLFLLPWPAVIILYLVIGMIYKWKKLGAVGLEMIPNIDFWKEFPFYFRDGFLVIWFWIMTLVGKIRGTGGPSGGGGGGGGSKPSKRAYSQM
jgi:hypothetical protein